MAEKCGLSECHMPLFDLLDRMAENGKKTASALYGCRGFCAHHNTNLWANTDPEGIFDASPIWPMGAAWLSLHLYEHYLFTLDMDFLKQRALPVMWEAIQFFEDYLYQTENNELVTGPSLSPENTYITSGGQSGSLCMGPAMDIQILRQLFTSYISGCCLAGIKNSSTKTAEQLLHGLPKTKITSDGRIMEWQKEYTEAEPGHRHISSLYGLHPGNEIIQETPELFRAAEKTLEYRLSHGGGHTGWSRAWIACFYARLKRGEKVLENMQALLCRSIQDNMLDTHPPFQIDGNFGIAEAILESLIQSHAGYIEVLPALPEAWEKGELRGVCLRGGVMADMAWENGKLLSLVLWSMKEQEIKVRYKERRKDIVLVSGTKMKLEF